MESEFKEFLRIPLREGPRNVIFPGAFGAGEVVPKWSPPGEPGFAKTQWEHIVLTGNLPSGGSISGTIMDSFPGPFPAPIFVAGWPEI